MTVVNDFDRVPVKYDATGVSVGIVRILHQFGERDMRRADESLSKLLEKRRIDGEIFCAHNCPRI